MSKILNMSEPYISHTPESSFIFSVLGNNDTSMEWLSFNFLSMVFMTDLKDDEFTWIGFDEIYKDCPFLNCVQINYSEANQSKLFTDFVEQMIDMKLMWELR